jgi:hypothetical protein
MATSSSRSPNAANLRRTPEALCDAANQRLGGMLQVQRSCLGNAHHLGVAEDRAKDIAVAERARARGLEVTALSQFSQRPLTPELCLLGLRAVLRAELRRGVDVLATCIRC